MEESGTILEFLTAQETRVVWNILLICFVFGGLGGLVAHLLRWPLGKDGSPTPTEAPLHWAASIVIGVAGAIGFLVFTIAVGGLGGEPPKLDDVLRTISVSVIAGFGARRLLPRMVDHLETQIAEVREKADEAKKEAKATEAKNEQLQGDLTALTKRLTDAEAKAAEIERERKRLEVNINLKETANKDSTVERRKVAIAEAKDLIANKIENSATWVALGRVYRWDKNLPKAIETLDMALSEIESGRLDKTNLDAVYYNRGLYRAMLSGMKDADVKEQCLKDLDKFFEAVEDTALEVKFFMDDEDWKPFADDVQEVIDKWSSKGQQA